MGDGLRVCARVSTTYQDPKANRLGVLFLSGWQLPDGQTENARDIHEHNWLPGDGSPSRGSYEGLVGVALADQWSAFRGTLGAADKVTDRAPMPWRLPSFVSNS